MSSLIHAMPPKEMRRLSPTPRCEICTYASHGVHFGVTSCRACAAFFRRSLVSGLHHVCRNGDLSCKIDKSERFFCRACRFDKCVRSGMRAEKIQQNRDPISSTIQSTSSCSQESQRRPVTPEPPPLTDGPLYDLNELMAEIKEIFNTPVDSPEFSKLCTLRKLEYGLKCIRQTQKRRYLEISSTMSFDHLTKARCQCLKNAARWLTFSSEFCDLSENEKLLVLKSTWHVWARLERLSMTVEIFGEKTFLDKIVFTSNTDAIYLIDVVRFNLKGLSAKEMEDVDKYLQPLYTAIFNELAVKLLDLKPSPMEIAFMLIQIVWCVSGKTLKGASLESGEKLMETISSDLHNYYEHDLNIEMYSVRLLKMMSIVRTMQKTYIDYQRVMGQAEEFAQLVADVKFE